MITRLAENLYRVISDLNIMITRGFHTDLKQNYKALETSINEFKETPDTLFKELFEPWCKEDFYRFCRLINTIQNKDSDWQMNSISLLPHFAYLFNELCLIYDEIEMRRPEIVKSVEADDTPKPDTSTDRVNLPEFAKIIDTPEMRKAQEIGLIDEQYKWLKGLQLLACFAREMSLKYKLNNAQNADGTPRVNWQIFERFFDIQKGKLRQNYNDIQKTGQQPRDKNLIDTLFK